MTKHRTVTGLVAVALLALAATTVTMRSHLPAINGATLVVEANKLPTTDFDDRWSAMFLSPRTDTAQHRPDIR